jgi:dimethylargininase
MTALEAIGLDVTLLPALDEHPDACFVEDPAILIGGAAVICRMGRIERRGEEAAVREHLRGRGYRVFEMEAPATADGGDVLRIGQSLYVGISSRTNRAGFDCIARVAAQEQYQAHAIEVVDAPHLKSICTGLGDDTIIAFEQHLGEGRAALLDSYHLIRPDADEPCAANVAAIESHVFVAANCPKTIERLGKTQLSVVPLNISELQKAEAAFTCMAILGLVPRSAG